MYTPWGQAQSQTFIAEGILHTETASHGGTQLSPARQRQLPAHAGDRNFNKSLTWWEEDCDWCVPFLVFQNEFRAYYERHNQDYFEYNLAAALKTAERHHPEFYAVFCTLHSQPTLFATTGA